MIRAYYNHIFEGEKVMGPLRNQVCYVWNMVLKEYTHSRKVEACVFIQVTLKDFIILYFLKKYIKRLTSVTSLDYPPCLTICYEKTTSKKRKSATSI
ncbi:hypothetical protein GDO86_019226 [Hymenochirus boettgeri]|uniref:Uncharacterized protein n=1 Tax=Hymenochirus boettgeri TaxID=247094 RepID=A0A8T2IHZ9_9PIPI|nr:hypothetical protein GDO86_019226 [Hymenochirus boettgeri]